MAVNSLASIPAYLIVLAGVYFFLQVRDVPEGPARRLGMLRSGLVFAVAFLWPGLMILCLIKTSQVVVVKGEVAGFRHHYRQLTETYLVQVADGSTVELNAFSSEIKRGWHVRATYLSRYSSLVDLKVLDGPEAGWTLHENYRLIVAVLLVIAGAIVALISWMVWVRSGRAANLKDGGAT